MAYLLFRPAELQKEITALQGLAAPFLDRARPDSLEALKGDLKGLEVNGGKHTLEIPEQRALVTRVSAGEFEPAEKRSSRRVFGSITGVWEVELSSYRIPDQDRPRKKVRDTQLIGFTGIASTRIEIVDADTLEILVCWKMELGDANSPGCFFHTHLFEGCGFPVPRHPSVFVTPMAAIGFALGELFQGEWEREVDRSGGQPDLWRSIQVGRFEALLMWQLDRIRQPGSSPWISLKTAKPQPHLFVR